MADSKRVPYPVIAKSAGYKTMDAFRQALARARSKVNHNSTEAAMQSESLQGAINEIAKEAGLELGENPTGKDFISAVRDKWGKK